ncbi:unnamed protein product, partial [Brachionus calyciflorus]
FNLIKTSKKLIYASLGTIFNYDLSVFERIIEAIRLLNDENSENNDKLKVLISCGQINMDKFSEKVKNSNYIIPKNVILLSYAPQIEILERASLFITHAGMNSTSEAIHYGVPVLCMPIKVDQPLCAMRLVDDLNLGVKIDANSFKPEDLEQCISKVLNDQSYLDRILKYSKLSRNYDGTKTTADIVECCI